MIDRAKLARRLDDLRHRLAEYPIDEIGTTRPRVIDRFETPSLIPRVIIQTYRTAAVVRPIHSAVTRWQETNPEFDHRFFDDDSARIFIQDRFPTEVLRAFDSLVPGAFRADLWRYCYLVECGGVYVDIRMEPLLALRTILDMSASRPPSFAAARDMYTRNSWDGFMYNAFIAATPGHPFLVAALERALVLISRRDYGRSCLDITGPGCFGAAINTALGKPVDSRFDLGDHEDERVGRYRILNHESDPYHRSVLAINGRPCIRTKCIHGIMQKADKGFPQDSYSKIYHTGRVYR